MDAYGVGVPSQTGSIEYFYIRGIGGADIDFTRHTPHCTKSQLLKLCCTLAMTSAPTTTPDCKLFIGNSSAALIRYGTLLCQRIFLSSINTLLRGGRFSNRIYRCYVLAVAISAMTILRADGICSCILEKETFEISLFQNAVALLLFSTILRHIRINCPSNAAGRSISYCGGMRNRYRGKKRVPESR